ncbi:MAG: hypothetical protein LBR44_11250 [Clostridiales Family XIII bacterium]|jgi:hypothetical protein|nr:hypothetical protein [Clostridiales Family XIII bacterium]
MEISVKKVFDTRDTAVAFAEKRLREKYGTRFAVNENKGVVSQTYLYKSILLCAAKCVEGVHAGMGCSVWVSDFGEEMDDFAANYYRGEAEAPFLDILSKNADLVGYEAVFVGSKTSAAFTPDLPLKDYLKKCRSAHVACMVELAEGLAPEHYAGQIRWLIKGLLQAGIPFALRARAGGRMLFVYGFDGSSRWTQEDLTREIEDNIRHADAKRFQ